MAQYGLRDEVLEFIVESAKRYGLKKVSLYGSRAKGTYREKSDIDLAIEGGRIYDFEYDLEERCPTLLSFDFIDLTDDLPNGLAQRIQNEGVVLYGGV